MIKILLSDLWPVYFYAYDKDDYGSWFGWIEHYQGTIKLENFDEKHMYPRYAIFSEEAFMILKLKFTFNKLINIL